MSRRRRRRSHASPLRAQCDEHLAWLLASCLLDRVPLPRIAHVTKADCDKIVEGFITEYADDVEQAIAKVEVNPMPGTNVTQVVDVLLPALVRFARKLGDEWLDKELSPYVGIGR